MSALSSSPTAPQSVPELLRILDVASALRRERERAVAELDLPATKAALRERLRAAATESGDPVTDAEIDAAIEQYYGTRHAFEEPAPSWRTVLAHLWVRRGRVGLFTAGLIVSLGLGFALFIADGAPFSAARRAQDRADAAWTRFAAARSDVDALHLESDDCANAARIVEEAELARTQSDAVVIDTASAALSSLIGRVTAAQAREASITARAAEAAARAAAASRAASARVSAAFAAIGAIALDPAVRTEASRLFEAATAASAADDVAIVTDSAARLERLQAQLGEEYEIRIVSRPGERSGIDAYFEDEAGKRVSGYYLIVEAITPEGRTLTRSIHDAELDEDRSVRKWGEQVPKAVYDRIADDKRADGVVDDRRFARKQRGRLDEEVLIPGPDGTAPLARGRRITTKL